MTPQQKDQLYLELQHKARCVELHMQAHHDLRRARWAATQTPGSSEALWITYLDQAIDEHWQEAMIAMANLQRLRRKISRGEA